MNKRKIKPYYYLESQAYLYDLEPVCALDPLLLIPRLEYLPPIFQLVRNKNSEITLTILDMKNFHIINDIYGYDVGDYVISEFITLLRKNLPENSISLRFRHGDEFLFFVPKSKVNTEKIFHSLKQETEQKNFFKELNLEQLFVSFRFASIQITKESNYIDLLYNAESELRKIKEQGSKRHF